MGLDDVIDLASLRRHFRKNSSGITAVSGEGDVLAEFDPQLTITKNGAGDVIRIDAEFEGHIARKNITYPDAVTTIVAPWAFVS